MSSWLCQLYFRKRLLHNTFFREEFQVVLVSPRFFCYTNGCNSRDHEKTF